MFSEFGVFADAQVEMRVMSRGEAQLAHLNSVISTARTILAGELKLPVETSDEKLMEEARVVQKYLVEKLSEWATLLGCEETGARDAWNIWGAI